MYQVFCVTDKGLKYDHNEDSYLVNDKAFQDTIYETFIKDFVLACVCDGVGGANKGEVASLFCANEISNNPSYFCSDLKNNILKINNELIETYGPNNLCSTLAGVFVSKDKVFIFNVGDSRIYKVSNNIAMQYSVDDSLETEGIKSHTITNYFGNPYMNNKTIHICESEMNDNDVFFICSDGVSDYSDIEKILENADFIDLNKISNIIKDEIYTYGAKDNFTMIFIKKIGE